ncbi:MAG: CopG family ribbon-helix-helix protein [Thermofilaceae archaeon]
MTRKRRFGISLDKDLFEELDRAAKAIGADRSRLISLATREYLMERIHFEREHECEGVLVASYPAEAKEEVDKLLESSGSLVLSRSHFHSRGGCCVEVIYLRGSSDSVWNLHMAIGRICRACRYIPTCL